MGFKKLKFCCRRFLNATSLQMSSTSQYCEPHMTSDECSSRIGVINKQPTDLVVINEKTNNVHYTSYEACCCECYCADCGSSSDNDEVFCCWNEN